jgi:hypothetical protein
MAFGSRSPEFLGWFRCGLGLILPSVIFWSQEVEQILGISVNKAVSWSFVVLVVSHAAGQSSSTFSVKLPWRKMKDEVAGTGSSNKCGYLQSCDFGAELFVLACLGGEGDEENNLKCTGSGWWRGIF